MLQLNNYMGDFCEQEYSCLYQLLLLPFTAEGGKGIKV